LDTFGQVEPAPKVANNLAWTCALGPAALDDYGRVIAMAETAVASRPELNRVNTLGAVLHRAGRHREALEQLNRAVALHGAGGTAYDAVMLAMVHHALGDRERASAWLERARQPAPVSMRKPDAAGASSWIPSLELELLRAEATALVAGSTP
jgi:Flp pilus assembly protein TadD